MKLSTLTLSIGIVFSLPQLFGLMSPAKFGQSLRRFPRSEHLGYVLMGLATAWFVWNLNTEALSDFASYKTAMMAGFGAVGLLTCLFVRDFLAVRGLAILMMLLAKLTLDTARWHDSQWRLVLAVWAYIWIVAGMWFTISPWRFRDWVGWLTATETRIRVGSFLRLAFGLFIVALGLFVF